MPDARKTLVEQAIAAWPILAAALTLGGTLGIMLISLQIEVGYVARDVLSVQAEIVSLREQVAREMSDRYTGDDHDAFVAREFSPLKERLRLVELFQAGNGGPN